MPECSKCSYLDGARCRAHELAKEELKRPLPPPPSGACMIPIVEQYLHEIKFGMRVLEVGCGSWTKIRDHCHKVGAHYDGIDPQKAYFGVESVATRIENLADLSFEDNRFDIVIGNQTMEHWGEHGCSLERGLYQCFRVCKPQGRVFLNVPIHFHGTKEFMLGDIDKLQRLFEKFSSDVHFERWGYPSDPIPAFHPFPGFSTLRNRPAHVLDIQAVKNKALPIRAPKAHSFQGKMARVVNYSVRFNLYRIAQKLKQTSANT